MTACFVGEIVGTYGRKARNKKWRTFVVIEAEDLTSETFDDVIMELHPTDYLMYDDYGELAWNHDHSGAMLMKAFKRHGYKIKSVETADLVGLFRDDNW